jgi:hypothetical protein
MPASASVTVRRRASSRTLAKPPAGAGGRRRDRASGQAFQPASAPPEMREASGGDVEGAATAPRQGIRCRQDREQILAHRHRDAGGRA